MRKLGAMVVHKAILILTFIYTHTYICTDVWAVLEEPCYCGCVPKVSHIVVIMWPLYLNLWSWISLTHAATTVLCILVYLYIVCHFCKSTNNYFASPVLAVCIWGSRMMLMPNSKNCLSSLVSFFLLLSHSQCLCSVALSVWVSVRSSSSPSLPSSPLSFPSPSSPLPLLLPSSPLPPLSLPSPSPPCTHIHTPLLPYLEMK